MGPLRRRVVAEVRPDRRASSARSHSTLPIGSGLSSRAALEVAVALALGADRLNPRDWPPRRASGPSSAAVGVPCGIMDQLASAAGVEGHGPAASTATRSTIQAGAVPRRRRDRGRSTRASTATLAGVGLRRAPGPVRGGRAGRRPAARRLARSTSSAIDDPVLRRRARHVITENERVDALTSALAKGQLADAGALLVASHASLRDDFEVSTPALDALVERRARRARRLRRPPHRRRVRRLRGRAVPPKTRAAHAGGLAGPAGGRRLARRPPDARPPASARLSRARGGHRPPAGRAPAAVRAPHQNRSWPSTSTTGRHVVEQRPRAARRTGTARCGASTTSGRRARDLVERHRRVADRGVGEHVGDAERGQQRRAVGAARHRHPRPPPDRDEGPQPGGRRSSATGGGGLGAPRCRARPRPRRRRGRPASAAPAARRPARRSTATPWPRPRPPSASASSRRFSSSHITTRSGARATMASTSGSLVPPTCGSVGLLAEAGARHGRDAPGQQRLGDRRDEADDPHGLGRAGHIRSRSCCFLAANSASVSSPWRRSSSSSRICAGIELSACCLGVARRHRHADAVVLAVLVGLDLPVDLVLHGGRMADVRERLAAHLARRLDDEVARAEHALEDRLAEEHRVDPVERDLDAVLGQHAVAVDEPVGGDDEVGGDPAGVAQAEPDEAAEDRARRPGLDASRCRCRAAATSIAER